MSAANGKTQAKAATEPSRPTTSAASDVPFDCFGDPGRGCRAVGLERGTGREYLGPQLAKGLLARTTTRDSADTPPIDEILSAVRDYV